MKEMRNPFSRNLALSILEILSIWPFTVICGMISCIYTARANTSFLDGRIADFQEENKKVKTGLWAGFAGFCVFLVILQAAFLFFSMDRVDKRKDEYYSWVDEDILNNNQKVLDEVTGEYRLEIVFETDKSYSIDRGRRYETTVSLEDTVLAGYNHFTLEGAEFILPMTYEDFLKLDFNHDTDKLSRILNPSSYNYASLYDKENDALIGKITFYNHTSYARPMSECIISSVQINTGRLIPEIELIHNITFDTDVEALMEYFGIPDEEFHMKESSACYYSWRAPLYGDNFHDNLTVHFSEGKIDNITISYLGLKDN